jgi:hypothetical protein
MRCNRSYDDAGCDERAVADVPDQHPLGLQLRERVVYGVARDVPVRGELT